MERAKYVGRGADLLCFLSVMFPKYLRVYQFGSSKNKYFKKFFNVYLLLGDRETQSVSRGGVERGGDIESEVGSRL